MKLSELVKRLQAELEKSGDHEVEAVELPPAKAKDPWTLDMRYG